MNQLIIFFKIELWIKLLHSAWLAMWKKVKCESVICCKNIHPCNDILGISKNDIYSVSKESDNKTIMWV